MRFSCLCTPARATCPRSALTSTYEITRAAQFLFFNFAHVQCLCPFALSHASPLLLDYCHLSREAPALLVLAFSLYNLLLRRIVAPNVKHYDLYCVFCGWGWTRWKTSRWVADQPRLGAPDFLRACDLWSYLGFLAEEPSKLAVLYYKPWL